MSRLNWPEVKSFGIKTLIGVVAAAMLMVLVKFLGIGSVEPVLAPLRAVRVVVLQTSVETRKCHPLDGFRTTIASNCCLSDGAG
jgi:hypothetical protein